MLTPNPKIFVFNLIVLVGLILSGCGSPKTTEKGESPLENAIAHYIEGDTETAEALFTEVIQQQKSQEDLITAYLYLGRIYMARGDYERAADAFSSGKLAGGDIRFDEYFELASMRSGISAARIAREATVTRGQLAALICTMFGASLGLDTTAGPAHQDDVPEGSAEAPGNWAAIYFESLANTGVMTPLPDGDYHPAAKVTKPALYVIAARLSNRLGLDAGATAEMFPGGYRGTIARDGEDDGIYVTGQEVVGCLERIAHTAGL